MTDITDHWQNYKHDLRVEKTRQVETRKIKTDWETDRWTDGLEGGWGIMFNSRLLVQRDHMTTNIPNTFRIPAEGGTSPSVCVFMCVCVCVCRCVRVRCVVRVCGRPANREREWWCERERLGYVRNSQLLHNVLFSFILCQSVSESLSVCVWVVLCRSNFPPAGDADVDGSY